jgi:hypothetical protein
LRGNWLLKHDIEGNIERKIEMTGRRGRIYKQLLDRGKDRSNGKTRKKM